MFPIDEVIYLNMTFEEALKNLEFTGSPIFNTIWTLTGMPAITLPLFKGKNNLPIGIQIVGQRRQEAMILNLGYHFEKQTKSNNLLPIDPIK